MNLFKSGNLCDFPHCASSRKIVSHWKTCTRGDYPKESAHNYSKCKENIFLTPELEFVPDVKCDHHINGCEYVVKV